MTARRLCLRQALLHPLHNLRVYAAVYKLFGDSNGIHDGAGFGSAVTDQTVSADPEQRRAAIFLPVMLGVDFFQHRLEWLSQLRRVLTDLREDGLKQSFRDAFGELEDDVAHKSVA